MAVACRSAWQVRWQQARGLQRQRAAVVAQRSGRYPSCTANASAQRPAARQRPTSSQHPSRRLCTAAVTLAGSTSCTSSGTARERAKSPLVACMHVSVGLLQQPWCTHRCMCQRGGNTTRGRCIHAKQARSWWCSCPAHMFSAPGLLGLGDKPPAPAAHRLTSLISTCQR